MSKVEVKNLTKSFGDLLVLDDVSFNVEQGEFLCIVGPTGCGKTTFLNSLTKIYDINKGSIKIDGEEVDLKKHSLAYIMQEYSTMSWLNVRQNVAFGLEIKKLSKQQIREKTDAALELVGLTKFADYYPNQLSASMMQRVAIARTLLRGTPVLILDDSLSAVDTATDAKIRKAFREEIPNTTKLIIAQRISSVQDADHILVLNEGEVNGYGTHEELLKNNEIYRDIYELQQKGAEE